MKTIQEGFDLLDIRGVDRQIQNLFSDVLEQDNYGRLSCAYYDMEGKQVDEEIIGLSVSKIANQGIIQFSKFDPKLVRSVFISDTVCSLIHFANAFSGRLDFEYAAFISTGSLMQKSLFLEAFNKYPNVRNIHTVYGNSLFGKVRDCKIQHWVLEDDCNFRIDGDLVNVQYKDLIYITPASQFSLRNHVRQLSIRQTISTYKPLRIEVINYGF